MRVAFVSGPYRAETPRGIVENIREAEEVALALWRLGYAAFCPHKNTALFDGAVPDGVWLKGDLEIMRRCDLVVMVQGWSGSRGARVEKFTARMLGIPVYEWARHQKELGEAA